VKAILSVFRLDREAALLRDTAAATDQLRAAAEDASTALAEAAMAADDAARRRLGAAQ
jgi:hypothetical protein